MRELKNGVLIIGTDLGYGNVKSSGSITRSSVDVYENEPIFTDNVLIYNGKYYRFGDGHKSFIEDKSVDEDFYMLNMIAMAREMYRAGIYEAKVHLATGLPLTWVRGQREKFREYLMKNRDLWFRYKNKEFHITLVGCSIYPQGYPAIVERLSEFKGINVLADIGNGTINIMYIKDKKPIESMCWTEKLGVNQCVMRMKKAVMDNMFATLLDSVAEDYLRHGTAEISKRYIDLLHNEAVGYVRDIFDALARHDYNPQTMKLYILGGGGCIVKNFGEYDADRVTIISDLCAAAKGFEYLAYLQLRKKV